MKDRTIASLKIAKGQWPAIQRETRVSYSWLCKLAQGQFADASSDKIERVYRALVRRGLAEPQVDFSDCA
ncbi:hypothetical protein [Marinobacter sp.]|uniref:hypothetical protein n=1 Tax=Marinobacter sp. TaxID=50741 RepID=UPI003A8E8983